MNLGRIVYLGDGVIVVRGLPNLRRSEQVFFKQPFSSFTGQVFDIDKDGSFRIALLDGNQKFLSVGDPVYRSFHSPAILTGFSLLGALVTPSGRLLNESELDSRTRQIAALFDFGLHAVETAAPTITDRYPIRSTFYTGINAIDLLLPLGLGQRELLVGDKGTGKTTLAVTLILHQRFINLDVHYRWRLVEEHFSSYKASNFIPCVFCSIGQRRSEICKLYYLLVAAKAMSYTTMMFSSADDNPGLQYIAPYSATTVAESFRDRGYNPMIVYDDLSNHAVAYRQISLLLRRPPGREAYPGDVFYLHSRLLERAGQLNKVKGGGSITAFPVIETKGNDLTAFIPTNVVSITDGQVYTSIDAQLKGLKPYIEIPSSVSRIGTTVQNSVITTFYGDLKSSYILFTEYEDIDGMSGVNDPYIMEVLRKGARIYKFMNQDMYESMRLYLQVVYLQGLTSDLLDSINTFLVPIFFRLLFNRVNASFYLKGADVLLYPFIVYPAVMDSVLMYLPEGSPSRFFRQLNSLLSMYKSYFMNSVQGQITADRAYAVLQSLKSGSFEYF